MNRRQFIDKLLYATGEIILVDQLELIEKLTPKKYWCGVDLAKGDSIQVYEWYVKSADPTIGYMKYITNKDGLVLVKFNLDFIPPYAWNGPPTIFNPT